MCPLLPLRSGGPWLLLSAQLHLPDLAPAGAPPAVHLLPCGAAVGSRRPISVDSPAGLHLAVLQGPGGLVFMSGETRRKEWEGAGRVQRVTGRSVFTEF